MTTELTLHTSEAHVRAAARAYGLTPERHDGVRIVADPNGHDGFREETVTSELVVRRWLEELGEFLVYRALILEAVPA